MAHLDDDVAAYVDGQLDPVGAEAARRHLQDCDRCRTAVVQQRQLKSRMGAAGDLAPPEHLLASLSSLPEAAGDMGGRSGRGGSGRLVGPAAWGALCVLMGASLVVGGLAYALGAPDRSGVPLVSPPVERYVQDFGQAVAAEPVALDALGLPAADVPTSDHFSSDHPALGGASGRTLSAASMNRLSANGWPCHPELAGGLDRIDGRVQETGGTLSLAYSDGLRRLQLHEQEGALAPDAVEAMQPRRFGDHWVHVSTHERIAGLPEVRSVVWDADGIVYTLVTDLREDRLRDALADLPASTAPHGWADRMSAGLARAGDWLAP